MKKLLEKFIPIRIDDKELLERIIEIKLEKSGFAILISDLAKARSIVEKKQSDWFADVIKKYNIPKKFNKELIYNHSRKEIRAKE